MRKILSVILAVVMLAALAVVIPVSAATTLPELVITEVCADSTGGSASYGNGELFEFIEIYNSSDKPLNLYDYTITLFNNSVAQMGVNPGSRTFTYFTPIMGSELSKSVGNTLGTIATSNNTTGTNKNPELDVWPYYPTNPETAMLQPGETALVWMYTPECFAYQYAYDVSGNAAFKDTAINLIDDNFTAFRECWNVDDDVLVVAIDANPSRENDDPTYVAVPSSTNKTSGNVTKRGTGTGTAAIYDMLKTGGFPSSNGRFNLANSNSRRNYGIAKTDDLRAENARTTLKFSDIVSYVFAPYGTDGNNDYNASNNLMNHDTNGEKSTTMPNVSYNFLYSNKASTFSIGKTANMVEYGDWLRCQYATPGTLLPEQVAAFAALGSEVAEAAVGDEKIVSLAYDFLIYEQNFDALSDSADKAAILSALGWRAGFANCHRDNPASAAAGLEISNGKLILTNDTTSDNLIGILTSEYMNSLVASTNSSNTDYNKKVAYADMLIEYDLTFLELTGTTDATKWVAFTYNYDDNISYNALLLRLNGGGYNMIRSNSVNNYLDVAGTYYSANNDTVVGRTSIINKITGGNENIGTGSGRTAMKMIDVGTVNVKYYVDQVNGPSYYINDILVSYASLPMWGMHRQFESVGIGLAITTGVKCEIDNIKITALSYDNEYRWPDWYTREGDQVFADPATGDMMVYVAIVMAVSFISLAVLVVVKRKSSVR